MSVSAALRKKIRKSIHVLETEIEGLRAQLKNGKKPKRLTSQEKREYLRDPGTCPYCESKNIEGGFVDIHTGGAAQPIKCIDCKRDWHDVYTLTDIEESHGR